MRLLIFLVLTSLCFVKINAQAVCYSNDDPHMGTFDGVPYEFQKHGDHFIMYDDFKQTRVTADYFTCVPGLATCNCAVHIKHGRKLVFVDFCGVTNVSLPVSQPYFVDTNKENTGLKALNLVPTCDIIPVGSESNPATWSTIQPIANSFKCARLQGSNFYTTYVIRTLEEKFDDSIQVKFQLGTLTMPSLSIEIGRNNFNSTGGLCGRWDGDRNTDLYVLDRYGQEDFRATTDIEAVGEFWKMASRYNKPALAKRCPECYTVSERSFYCPCDDFNLFDIDNYNLGNLVRPNYCAVPWRECASKFWNPEHEIIPEELVPVINSILTTPDPGQTTTTPGPTPPPGPTQWCIDKCENAFYNHTQLGELISKNCTDVSSTINNCAIDICFTAGLDEHFIQMHIQQLLDQALQNFLITGDEFCKPEPPCRDNCNDHGVCVWDNDCLNSAGNIKEKCLSPVKCECVDPWIGRECSINKNDIASLSLVDTCCDLRSGSCSVHRASGNPFATTDPIYVKAVYTEPLAKDRFNKIVEYSQTTALSENSLIMNLGKLNELALFKNINGLHTDLVLSESTTSVQISISYLPFPRNTLQRRDDKLIEQQPLSDLINETTEEEYITETATIQAPHFSQSATLTLYDSKCRTCHNQWTNSLTDKCEINGVCYATNEIVGGNQLEICDPDFSIDESVMIQRPGLFCNRTTHGWSTWVNSDSPNGDGDLELFGLPGSLVCGNLSILNQVHAVSGGKYTETKENVHYNECFGFMCLNKENSGGCSDYHYRQCCPKLYLTTTTAASTTPAPITEPVTEPAITEPVTEPAITEPVTTPAPITEPVTEPAITEPVTEPAITEPVTEPAITEPVTEPAITEPVTEPAITEPTELLTTEPTTTNLPCAFTLSVENGNGNLPLSASEGSELNVKFLVSWTTPECQSEPIVWNVKPSDVVTKGYTATEGVDFSTESVINLENGVTAKFNILNDQLVEPFEFFSVEFNACLTISDAENCQSIRQIVYIRDDDYGTGTVDKTGIYDFFVYDEAQEHIHPSFYNYEGQLTNLDSKSVTSVFPSQGGLTSPYSRLKIIFEDLNAGFRVHTIEINNPDQCNLIQMSARRLSGTKLEDLTTLDQFLLDSFYLNGQAFIDIDYYRAFNSSPDVAGVEYLELNWLVTRDGNNPGSCEVRVFGTKI